MTSQLIASSRPAPGAPSPGRHRRIRTAAVMAGVAALIATGGYVASTIGPDAAAPTSPTGIDVTPSAQVLRELRQSIARQYGSQSAAADTVNPNAQVRRELRESIAGRYGSPR